MRNNTTRKIYQNLKTMHQRMHTLIGCACVDFFTAKYASAKPAIRLQVTKNAGNIVSVGCCGGLVGSIGVAVGMGVGVGSDT